VANYFKKNLSKYYYGSALGLSLAAIISGGIIYILFRPSEYLFFDWIEALGLRNLMNAARNASITQELNVPQWIIYSLPNGLWAFAYALIITRIWRTSKSWLKLFWIGTIPVLVLGFEILQYNGTISGTFCIQDIVFGIVGLYTGILIGKKLSN
jgi:hypothetical protein